MSQLLQFLLIHKLPVTKVMTSVALLDKLHIGWYYISFYTAGNISDL